MREETEFKAGHVPGTVNVSRGRLEFRIWKQLGYPDKVDMNRKIYVQCATGGRATLAARQLKDIGFTNVTAVVMQQTEWQKKGYPFVKDESKQGIKRGASRMAVYGASRHPAALPNLVAIGV